VKAILARSNQEVLERFARSSVLVAFDYDGTLAPLTPLRDRAGMRPATRRLLARVAALYPCILITGRSRADGAQRVAGTGVREVLGNHGIEPWHVPVGLKTQVQGWVRALRRRLAPIAGVEIEDKAFSLTLHYRRASHPARAHAAIRRAAGSLRGARLIDGEWNVNLLSTRALDRGRALEAARARLGCETALYVGDEEADEAVFARGDPQGLLGIRVGRKAGSRAAYFLRGQREVDGLLRRLVDLRRRRGGNSGSRDFP
jgi:trehalose 6-phosphate phosphatase